MNKNDDGSRNWLKLLIKVRSDNSESIKPNHDGWFSVPIPFVPTVRTSSSIWFVGQSECVIYTFQTQKALYLFKNRKNPVYINNLLIIIGISRCECQIDFDGRHSKLYLTQKCQKDATRHGPNHTLCFRYTQSYIQCTFYPMWLV